jgi:hypothetical protein
VPFNTRLGTSRDGRPAAGIEFSSVHVPIWNDIVVELVLILRRITRVTGGLFSGKLSNELNGAYLNVLVSHAACSYTHIVSELTYSNTTPIHL